MIVSDWLWVARERALGDDLLFTPYSTALGAVMAPKDSPIASLADLKGKSIGVAGGPIDKSWLMLRALALRSGADLAKDARPVYGAPPLIAEKLAQGETDAALEFWNFCADLEARGFKRVIEMDDVEKALGAKGPVAMTGYVFKRRLRPRPRAGAEALLRDAGQSPRRIAQRPASLGARSAPASAPRTRRRSQSTASRYLDGAPNAPGRRGGRGCARPVQGHRRDRRRGTDRRRQGSRPPAAFYDPAKAP